MLFQLLVHCSHIVTRSDIAHHCIENYNDMERTQIIFWINNRHLSSLTHHKQHIGCLLCLWCNPLNHPSYQPVCTSKHISSIKFPMFPSQILITMKWDPYNLNMQSHSLLISDNHQWLFLANCCGWYMVAPRATDTYRIKWNSQLYVR